MVFQKYHNIRPIYITRELKNVCPIPLKANTYHGCSYGCKYCNVNIISKTRTDRQVKPIPLQYLYDTFKRARNGKGLGEIHKVIKCSWPVQLGVLADPFPPVERLYRNTLHFMRFVSSQDYPMMILTKSDMILEPEYFDLLNDDIQIIISIPFPSKLSKKLEPNVPSPKRRLQVLKELVDNNIKCTLRVWPLLAGLNDEVSGVIFKALDIGVPDIQASYGHVYGNKKYLDNLNSGLGFDYLEYCVDNNITMIYEKKYYMPQDNYRIKKLREFKDVIEPVANFYTPNSPVLNGWMSCCGEQLNNYNSDALKCKGYLLGDGIGCEDYIGVNNPFKKVFEKEFKAGKFTKFFSDIKYNKELEIYERC